MKGLERAEARPRGYQTDQPANCATPWYSGSELGMNSTKFCAPSGKLVTGRARQCPLMVYIFAVLFVLRYVIAPG